MRLLTLKVMGCHLTNTNSKVNSQRLDPLYFIFRLKLGLKINQAQFGSGATRGQHEATHLLVVVFGENLREAQSPDLGQSLQEKPAVSSPALLVTSPIQKVDSAGMADSPGLSPSGS